MGNCSPPGCRWGVYDDVFFCAVLFPLDVLAEILDLSESVSEVFLLTRTMLKRKIIQTIVILII